LKRNIITTSDGSTTIQIEDWNEQYHSIHGAINEANHVFIKHGFLFYNQSILIIEKEISILEIGFGTGLNTFLTAIEAEKYNLKIDYVGVEAYPISSEEVEAMNYPELISEAHSDVYKNLHEVSWETLHKITPCFYLTKRKQLFSEISDTNKFNIIYFDAFGARVQPELWTETMFQIMYNALKEKGVLVTYSAKGSVRRAMQSVGFKVERLPGPPGKREMLRACKEA
jgi:tRNA U34 5-methylaminomethyl-2-thiouridine-forming methyltransferase MnmC